MRDTHTILPKKRWTTDPNGEIDALIVSHDHQLAPGIILSIVEDSADEFGDPIFKGRMDGDSTLACETAGTSAQAVADDLVDALVNWMMEQATPAQMLAFVPASGLAGKERTQRELAVTLGVSQPTVSNWLANNHQMDGAARAHIMRKVGLHRFDDKWVLMGPQDA